jgi:aryl-alcohol dehydrogenase-like predicted oxidoreductase
MNRIALGTAQFGMTYGISNTIGQVPVDEVTKILQYANEKGIDTLDTASVYGNSENILGLVGVEDWKVISKIPALPPKVSNIYKWIMDQIECSLERANIKSLDAVLLHKPADMLGSNYQDYQRALKDAKSSHLVGAIGYSIYAPQELTSLCSLLWPDIVQAPFNIFDRRIKKSGWLDKLNQRGTRIHVRSVFLQGLLVMPKVNRPSWFLPWENLLNRWDQTCLNSGLSPATLALSFAINEPGIEKVVLGVENTDQLTQLLEIKIHQLESDIDELACEDADLIEPFRWKFK